MSVLTARECAELDFLMGVPDWVQAYPSGRRCESDGCGTILSIYNPSTFCAQHEPEPDWVYQSRKFRYCPVCDLVVKVRLKSQSGVAVCKKCATPPQPVPETVRVVFPNRTIEMELK